VARQEAVAKAVQQHDIGSVRGHGQQAAAQRPAEDRKRRQRPHHKNETRSKVTHA
jgi:hypothetical protein